MAGQPMTRAILLALLLAGCGHPDRIPLDARVSVSSSFTAEQTESVVLAIDGWKGATGGRARLSPQMGDCGGCQLQIGLGAVEGGAAETDIGSNDTAVMRIDLGGLELAASQDKQPVALVLQDTVMHELGHAFGLAEHEPGTLMRATGFGGAKVDARTLERFDATY